MIIRSLILALFALALALLLSRPVKAEPMASAEAGGIRITVYTEDCAMKETVQNLIKRATWTENGKTIEGCGGVFPQIGIAVFYFADKTVVPVPLQMFERVSNS